MNVLWGGPETSVGPECSSQILDKSFQAISQLHCLLVFLDSVQNAEYTLLNGLGSEYLTGLLLSYDPAWPFEIFKWEISQNANSSGDEEGVRGSSQWWYLGF